MTEIWFWCMGKFWPSNSTRRTCSLRKAQVTSSSREIIHQIIIISSDHFLLDLLLIDRFVRGFNQVVLKVCSFRWLLVDCFDQIWFSFDNVISFSRSLFSVEEDQDDIAGMYVTAVVIVLSVPLIFSLYHYSFIGGLFSVLAVGSGACFTTTSAITGSHSAQTVAN